MTATTILEVRGLTVRTGASVLLDRVDLAVEAGTLHGLVGPNGAGKTTLLRCVLGLVPFEGDIRLRFRRDGVIGYVPQLLAVDPSIPLTVADLFTLLLRRSPVFLPRGRDARLGIERALLETGCAALVDRLVADLSGGEMRRVLLAQALVPQPELLLLDEPASSVDEAGARLFEDILLRQCRERGTTVLMVGHDRDFMARAADRITALDRRVTFDGRPSDRGPALAQGLAARGAV